MKTNSKLFLFLILFIAFLFNGCEKEPVNISLKSDNINIFKTPIDFTKTMKDISGMSDKEFSTWTKENNFKSVWDIQNEFYTELANMPSDIEAVDVEQLVSNYGDYFEIVSDKNGEQEIREKIPSRSIAAVCNEDNVFLIDEVAYKCIDEGVLSTNKTNIEDLIGIENITPEIDSKNNYTL